MYLDISSNQGKINWQEMREKELNINGIILRATTKNNCLDTRLIENYNGILHNMSDIDEISVYKFSYARDYISARVECRKCIAALAVKGIHYDYLYLDLESDGKGDFTKSQASAVILGYIDEMQLHGIFVKLRLYFNYNYLKNIIDEVWRSFPIWLARYNSTMGDTFGANIVLWQYTSTGTVAGIKGNVDISKEIAT